LPDLFPEIGDVSLETSPISGFFNINDHSLKCERNNTLWKFCGVLKGTSKNLFFYPKNILKSLVFKDAIFEKQGF
jgi:hypothetical protein